MSKGPSFPATAPVENISPVGLIDRSETQVLEDYLVPWPPVKETCKIIERWLRWLLGEKVFFMDIVEEE